MRWKGLITLLVLIAAVAVVSIFFLNGWMEKGLEMTGEAIVGAKVEVDKFHFSLITLSAGWDRLQVADPAHTWHNIIETGRAGFKMNPAAAWRKRVVIEELALTELRSGTKRATDGGLKRKVKKSGDGKLEEMLGRARDALENEIRKMPVVNLDPERLKAHINVDSLIAQADLRMPARVDSVRSDINKTAAKWEAFYKTFKPGEDLQNVRSELSAIRVSEIKTLPSLIVALEKVESSRRTFNQLYTTVNEQYDEVHADFDRLGGYRAQLGGWINDDYHSILRKARLPDLSAPNLGKMLFGPAAVRQAGRYLNYFQILRRMMKKKDPGSAGKPPEQRMRGETIRYADRHGWPAFLIRKIALSGQTGADPAEPGYRLEGLIRGLTTQPKIYGAPTQIELSGARAGEMLTFSSVLDHTREAYKDRFVVKLDNVNLSRFELPESSYLPERISRGLADLSADFSVDAAGLSGLMQLSARDVLFNFSQYNRNDFLSNIVRQVLSRSRTLQVRSGVDFLGGQLNFTVASNIDRLISAELQKTVSDALTAAQNRIMSYVESQTRKLLPSLNALYESKLGAFAGPLDDHKLQADEIQTLFKARIDELVASIDQKKGTGSLEKKAQDLLKELLK